MSRKGESSLSLLMEPAVIDAHGHLSVPKQIRDKLGLHGPVTLIALENCLLLVPQQDELETIASHIQSVIGHQA